MPLRLSLITRDSAERVTAPSLRAIKGLQEK